MSIRLTTDLRLLSEFSAVNCAPGGGRTERIAVPFQHGEIDLPPSDLDGIIVTGDLQFYDRMDVPEEDRKLMGFVVAEEIHALCEAGLLPDAKRIGVILVGDLYAEPSLLSRGGSGDVDDIWREFADRFRWVVGVSGNHDLFEGGSVFPSSFEKISNIHALDKSTVNLDGLRFGGISGILGNPRKIWRYTDPEFWRAAKRILKNPLDCLVLHQGPIGSKKGMRGAGLINEAIREAACQPSLVTFGHCHWPEPVDSQEGMEFLNADGRVFLLTRRGIEIDV